MKRGEIVRLGRHKLMCGDATSIEDVNELVAGERVGLVLTDPPYGMKCQSKDGTIGKKHNHECMLRDVRILSSRKYEKLIGDENNHSAKKFYEIVKDYNAIKIFWGGQYFADFLPVSGAWLFCSGIRRLVVMTSQTESWRGYHEGSESGIMSRPGAESVWLDHMHLTQGISKLEFTLHKSR